MSIHTRLAPSNHRWPKCPGSVREEKKYPDILGSGTSAIDGTGSHLLLELVLSTGKSINSFLGKIIGINHEDKINGWMIYQDRINRVSMVVSYIERRKIELLEEFPNCEVIVNTEIKSNPGRYFNRSDWWGTVDVVILARVESKTFFIEVVDLKDGFIFVEIYKNPQLIAYLAGKVLFLGIENIQDCRMTLIQPKSRTPVRYADIAPYDLLDEITKLAEAAKMTDHPDALLIADKKQGEGYCKWCKHKPNCEALKEKIIRKLEVTTVKTKNKTENPLFKTITEIFENIEEMDSNKLSEFLDSEAPMLDMFKRAKEEIEKRIINGEKVPRWGRKPGNSKKEWALSQEEIEKILKNRKFKKNQIWISSFISPAQALGNKNITAKQKDVFAKEFIKLVPGETKLCRVSEEDTDSISGLVKEIQEEIKTEKKKNFLFY